MRILFWSLGSICSGCNLSATALRSMVAAGLFLNGIDHCLACCLSVGFDVLVDGENRKLNLNYAVGYTG